jgi:hypothetical protein
LKAGRLPPVPATIGLLSNLDARQTAPGFLGETGYAAAPPRRLPQPKSAEDRVRATPVHALGEIIG